MIIILKNNIILNNITISFVSIVKCYGTIFPTLVLRIYDFNHLL
jgi:hypothetical protein